MPSHLEIFCRSSTSASLLEKDAETGCPNETNILLDCPGQAVCFTNTIKHPNPHKNEAILKGHLKHPNPHKNEAILKGHRDLLSWVTG